MKKGLIFVPAVFAAGLALGILLGAAPPLSAEPGDATPKVQYLEIVTRDVDAVAAAYSAALGVEFGEPDPILGGARTAPMANGGMVGIRAPLRDDEDPVVRPYWLVADIEAAVENVVREGGLMAHSPLSLPGLGTFAIYHQEGNDHGLWEL